MDDETAARMLLAFAEGYVGTETERVEQLRDDLLAGLLPEGTTSEVVRVVLRNIAYRNPGMVHTVYKALEQRLEAKARGRGMSLGELLAAHTRGESVETH